MFCAGASLCLPFLYYQTVCLYAAAVFAGPGLYGHLPPQLSDKCK